MSRCGSGPRSRRTDVLTAFDGKPWPEGERKDARPRAMRVEARAGWRRATLRISRRMRRRRAPSRRIRSRRCSRSSTTSGSRRHRPPRFVTARSARNGASTREGRCGVRSSPSRGRSSRSTYSCGRLSSPTRSHTSSRTSCTCSGISRRPSPRARRRARDAWRHGSVGQSRSGRIFRVRRRPRRRSRCGAIWSTASKPSCLGSPTRLRGGCPRFAARSTARRGRSSPRRARPSVRGSSRCSRETHLPARVRSPSSCCGRCASLRRSSRRISAPWDRRRPSMRSRRLSARASSCPLRRLRPSA